MEPLSKDNDVTGLRRATLAEPVLIRSRSPLDETEQAKSQEVTSPVAAPESRTFSSTSVYNVTNATRSLATSASPHSHPTHSGPAVQKTPQSREGSTPSAKSPVEDLTPTTRRITTGGQIVFSIPPRPSLTPGDQVFLPPVIESVVLSQQQTLVPAMSSSSEDELPEPPRGGYPEQEAIRPAHPTSLPHASAHVLRYSDLPVEAQEFFRSDSPPPPPRARGSDSGIAYLQSPVKVSLVCMCV